MRWRQGSAMSVYIIFSTACFACCLAEISVTENVLNTHAYTQWMEKANETFTSSHCFVRLLDPSYNGSGKILQDYIGYKIYYYSWLYAGPVLILTGTTGNVLTFIVLQTRLLRETGTTFLLSKLAVVDTMVLLVGVMRKWVIHLTEIDVRTFGNVSCKLHVFLTYVAQQWSGWTLVLVAAERCLVVWFPFQAKACFPEGGSFTSGWYWWFWLQHPTYRFS